MFRTSFNLWSRLCFTLCGLGGLAGCASLTPSAEKPAYFISIQDGRAGLEDGKSVVRQAPDSLAVIEVLGGRLRQVLQLDMPTSLVGPPSSVAIAPGGRLALISAATRRDPADPGKVLPHDLVSVVKLDPEGVHAPQVIQRVTTGAGASGISINRAGTAALVANRVEGSVSLLSIDGDRVALVSTLKLGDQAGPAHAAFTPDGTRALVTRDGDSRISLLTIQGRTLKLDSRVLFAGVRPYGLDISPDGAWAAVTNLGGGAGDADTVSLIDLRSHPIKVIDTVTVGQTPEGIFFSPNGRLVGVTVIDGSNKSLSSPFHGTARYRLFAVKDGRLQPVSDLMGGQWLQGSAYTPEGDHVLVQDAANRQIRLYRLTSDVLTDSGERLQFEAAPATLKFWR